MRLTVHEFFDRDSEFLAFVIISETTFLCLCESHGHSEKNVSLAWSSTLDLPLY